MRRIQEKRGAIQLSMSTVVVLVLAMTMLILGIILIKDIFGTASNAITDIDTEVQSSIREMFADSDSKLVIYPSSREITIQQGSTGSGFAFSVRNKGIEDKEFSYEVYTDPDYNIQEKCNIRVRESDSWLAVNSGSFPLGKGNQLEMPELIKFNIPETAPPCMVLYRIDVEEKGGGTYAYGKVYMTIEPE